MNDNITGTIKSLTLFTHLNKDPGVGARIGTKQGEDGRLFPWFSFQPINSHLALCELVGGPSVAFVPTVMQSVHQSVLLENYYDATMVDE